MAVPHSCQAAKRMSSTPMLRSQVQRVMRNRRWSSRRPVRSTAWRPTRRPAARDDGTESGTDRAGTGANDAGMDRRSSGDAGKAMAANDAGRGSGSAGGYRRVAWRKASMNSRPTRAGSTESWVPTCRAADQATRPADDPPTVTGRCRSASCTPSPSRVDGEMVAVTVRPRGRPDPSVGALRVPGHLIEAEVDAEPLRREGVDEVRPLLVAEVRVLLAHRVGLG